MIAGGAHDEGLDGPLCVPTDGGRPCEGKGGGIRGWARGAEGMESRPWEDWPDKEAPKRGRGADKGIEESAQGQGGRSLLVQEAASSG